LADVYVEAGRFDDALLAATRAAALDPRRLRSRRLQANLLLKHDGQPREALAEFESIIAHAGFVRLDDRAQVYADAAAAALAVGAGDRAIELADLSLAADRGNPPAVLHKARALLQRGDRTGAETALREADLSRLQGHEQARYHVGAARVYLRLGRDRMAVAELVDAREADPHWPVAALDTARVRLRIRDLMGAIEMVEAVAYMDRLHGAARGPLHRVWFPQTDWVQMRTDLERGLIGDVRFEARGAGVLGVVSWAGGMAGAQRQLERAVRDSEAVPAAHAALAQIMIERGESRAARFHADALLASRRDAAIIRAIKGRAMVAAGDAKRGAAELAKAIQDDAGSPGVRRHMALALQQQGDVPGAVAAWRDLQRLSPGDVSAQAALLALEGAGR
ncbi:MAG: hypothetical protein VX000_07280, partial [Myxococcota bacterium]|nr:hypothetical protein [Myxococcota bacterium]